MHLCFFLLETGFDVCWFKITPTLRSSSSLVIDSCCLKYALVWVIIGFRDIILSNFSLCIATVPLSKVELISFCSIFSFNLLTIPSRDLFILGAFCIVIFCMTGFRSLVYNVRRIFVYLVQLHGEISPSLGIGNTLSCCLTIKSCSCCAPKIRVSSFIVHCRKL